MWRISYPPANGACLGSFFFGGGGLCPIGKYWLSSPKMALYLPKSFSEKINYQKLSLQVSYGEFGDMYEYVVLLQVLRFLPTLPLLGRGMPP